MTSDDHELHTLAGAFVLDAVSEQERASFAAHLAGCAQCRDEVAELREAAARLGTAQAVQPRPELKETVIRAAYRTGQVGPVVAEQERAGGARRRPRARRVRRATTPSVLTAAAAIAAAVAIAFGTHYADMRDRQPTGPVAAVLNAPDAVMRTAPISSGGMAVIVSSRHEHMAVFIAHGLRRLPAARSYELWLMGPTGERAAGMLTMRSRGMVGPSLIRGVTSGDMVGLTVEPASGSLHPTSRPLVLVGASS